MGFRQDLYMVIKEVEGQNAEAHIEQPVLEREFFGARHIKLSILKPSGSKSLYRSPEKAGADIGPNIRVVISKETDGASASRGEFKNTLAMNAVQFLAKRPVMLGHVCSQFFGKDRFHHNGIVEERKRIAKPGFEPYRLAVGSDYEVQFALFNNRDPILKHVQKSFAQLQIKRARLFALRLNGRLDRRY